jgi:hypothetical protein
LSPSPVSGLRSALPLPPDCHRLIQIPGTRLRVIEYLNPKQIQVHPAHG